MNYHMIRTDDMLNGSGLRVVLFVSGCSHCCKGCHNPETQAEHSGKPFTEESAKALFNELDKEYISGITLSGGDPLFKNNRKDILELVTYIKEHYPTKNIWLYTGYNWEEIIKDNTMFDIIKMCDVVVEDRFKLDLMDVNYPYAGSVNQRVIDIPKTLETNTITLIK